MPAVRIIRIEIRKGIMKNVIVKTLDNRALVLALDYLYREGMKLFEVEKLLPASRKLIDKLPLKVIDAPIEGYYCESEEQKEYFLKIRTLQQCSAERKQEVENIWQRKSSRFFTPEI